MSATTLPRDVLDAKRRHGRARNQERRGDLDVMRYAWQQWIARPHTTPLPHTVPLHPATGRCVPGEGTPTDPILPSPETASHTASRRAEREHSVKLRPGVMFIRDDHPG